jgi:hypothetical protein
LTYSQANAPTEKNVPLVLSDHMHMAVLDQPGLPSVVTGAAPNGILFYIVMMKN